MRLLYVCRSIIKGQPETAYPLPRFSTPQKKVFLFCTPLRLNDKNSYLIQLDPLKIKVLKKPQKESFQRSFQLPWEMKWINSHMIYYKRRISYLAIQRRHEQLGKSADIV